MRGLKKYYKFMAAAVIVMFALIYFLNRTVISTDGYNVDNVYNTIRELSSDKYKGRRYGTKENMEAVKYIENQFKEIGLKPEGDDGTYLKNYSEITRTYDGAAILEVLDDDGKVVKQYKYGDDFIEQGYGNSIAGELTSGFNFIQYNGIELEKTSKNNLIAMAALKDRDPNTLQDFAIALSRANYGAVLTTKPDNTDLKKESASVGNRLPYKSGYEMPSLIVKDRVSSELYTYSSQGYKLHMKSTFDVAFAPVADVIGMIPGRGSEYLLITAHLDHVGPGSDGTIYPGALDNASGVASMLELARYIKSQDKKPSKNIVFITFNGEEGGLLGSKRYVSNPDFPLFKTSVINLDMLGANRDMPLTFMSSTIFNREAQMNLDPSSKGRYHLEKLADKLGIPYNEANETASDHAYFNSVGISAITLIDYDKDKVHTPADNMDNISKKNLDRALKLMMSYISLTAYSNMSANGYSMVLEDAKNFLAVQSIFVLVLAVLLFLTYIYYKKRKAGSMKPMVVPVLSIALLIVIMGMTSYFPIKYPYAPTQSGNALTLMWQGVFSIVKSILFTPLFVMFVLPGIGLLYFIKARMRGWSYRGNGKEYDRFYYLAMVLTIICSLSIAVIYDKPVYLALTPDFARFLAGKIVLYVIFGIAAYFIYRVFSMELGVKGKGVTNLIIFSIIFYMILSSFYMPIATNKFVMNLKANNINMGDYKNAVQ